ncbi:MAG: HindIII family type II restriction endonuclease [Chloroflexota bacterium]|nr:HindIII family type II restriction endonuclease [Chloroflexota bacterium]
MDRNILAALVQSIARDQDAFDVLERRMSGISPVQLLENLLHCGIIPEQFSHDSSEEKLWAKYCDILLNMTFNLLEIRSEVIRVRGDSADIRGVSSGYSIVADAKAFRLSRTAKNQKDFKISALDDWRRGDTYACLVAPLYQYPTRSSQIYMQAESRNVTLLSYVHLRFLLDKTPSGSLEPLWSTAASLEPGKGARRYWEAVDDSVVAITNSSYQELRNYKQHAINAAREVGREGISYWESVKRDYRQLSKEAAISKLIKAEKIDQKIDFIARSIDKVSQFLDA